MPTLPSLLRLMQPKALIGRLSGPEDAIVLAFAADLRAWTVEGRLRAVWTKLQPEVGFVGKNSPEKNRARARYAKALAMGMIPGAPDFVFTWSDGSGWIEAKSSTGSLSPDQRDFREWATSRGVRHAVLRSRGQGAEILQDWGVLRLDAPRREG